MMRPEEKERKARLCQRGESEGSKEIGSQGSGVIRGKIGRGKGNEHTYFRSASSLHPILREWIFSVPMSWDSLLASPPLQSGSDEKNPCPTHESM